MNTPSEGKIPRCIFWFVAVLLLLLPSCNGSLESAPAKPIVIATTGMIADLARQIGGEHIEVIQLIGDGVDPHLYRPNSDDVRQIRRGQLVLYNGLHLEGRMGDVLEAKSGNSKGRHVPVCERLPDLMSAESAGVVATDPHCWMDVHLWAQVAKVVESEIASLVPEHKPHIQQNGMELSKRLDELDQRVTQWIESIPSSHRLLVSSHDAFQYFGRRYQIQVEGVQGISTTSEAGLKRIEDLVSMLVEKKVPAVFVESSVPEKSVLSLREGALQRGWTVQLGGTLYTDAMGNTPPTNTYIGMMEHNAKTIAMALGGSAD